MSESTKIIDARGLPCPQPVVLTKKAVDAGGFAVLEVLVDNDAARENVLRYAGYAGLQSEALAEEGSTRRIVIRSGAADGTAASAAAGRPATAPSSTETRESGNGYPLTVFIPTDVIGRGDDQLGRLLMRGFTYALTEGSDLPARIVLMNAGVKLAVEGSESLAHLRKLADFGVQVLACGTCLEFYGLKDKLAVGRVSNMYEIAEILQSGRTLTV